MANKIFMSKLKSVKGVVLDITGVLKDGNIAPITGSVDALDRLFNAGLHVRLCTNETSCTRKSLVNVLNGLGFNIQEEIVFSPVPAMCHVLKERNLRPHLLVHKDSLPDFEGVDQSNPNCVVIGDAAQDFSYENVNAAFRCLIKMEQPVLFSMGKGKYYKEKGELQLDAGAYLKAIEYATGVTGEIVGKPSATFFNTVIQDIGVSAAELVMVGDDIVNDIGGAQACGMIGVQVRTGKFRPSDEPHPTVTPDAYVNNLAEFTDILLANISR